MCSAGFNYIGKNACSLFPVTIALFAPRMRRRFLQINEPPAPVLRLTQARIESDTLPRKREGRMARKRTAFLILMFVIATAGAARAAPAEDCLAGPNAQSPQGKHWYYRIDRATHRK